ncbi:tRNA-splicing ligase RtcB-domain-containing protein [Sphaerosporella brunnea]|uniref:3'-phosphate/5'-hydroxy nucleic acid ligase n=1 Tax=Sphaerosporella brunnea TaxID=1250544 RepID=A0A5J5EV44_9PEZI|nr:tRNA-splicing ligase RtcB-domain-containing protein [Sphaerosporella brunnea]
MHRLTLAKNSNRTQRTIILLSPSTADPFGALVAGAKTKLRVRTKHIRFFALPTGAEITDSATLLHTLGSSANATVLVSSGEDYIGASAAAPPTSTTPIVHLAKSTYADPLSEAQLSAAAQLPGILLAVGQPDLHAGSKFPIGAAFVSDAWLHPPLIGSDIGCGMSWYRLTLPRAALAGKGACERIAETLRGLEGAWMTSRERSAWLGVENSSGVEKFDAALGTIGAGNHFAEIQTVEEGAELAGAEVLLLVHSGSRGLGGDVLGRFYSPQEEEGKSGQISIADEPERAKEYLALHDEACQWAHANRDLIALRFLQKLEPGGAWSCDSGTTIEDIAALRRKLRERKWVDIHHNNVVKTLWPPQGENEAPEPQKEVFIHRKGAAPTDAGHPLLPLPGSRGTPTLILKPLFTAANGFGGNHALSAAHGAGRSMSRTKASEKFRNRYDEASGARKKGDTSGEKRKKGDRGHNDGDFLAGGGGGGGGRKGKSTTKGDDEDGGWVVCEDKELVWEEAPEAYKDVESVAKDLVDAGVAEIVGRCVPRVTYKLRKE